jgi:hypothetical protein
MEEVRKKRSKILCLVSRHNWKDMKKKSLSTRKERGRSPTEGSEGPTVATSMSLIYI